MTSDVSNKGLERINLALGAILACAAFWFTDLPSAAWNAGVAGLLIVCCSALSLARYGDWIEWSNLTLGCWAVVAPLLLGFKSAEGPLWTHVVIGLCVATIAAAQLVASRKAQPHTSGLI